MHLLTFEEWLALADISLGFRTPSYETFCSSLTVEKPSGKLVDAETWSLGHVENPLTDKDVEFWYECMYERREEYLRDYFDRRLIMDKPRTDALGGIFSGADDVAESPCTSLIPKTPLTRLVRQLHWLDLCDTPLTTKFTEVEIIRCIWKRCRIPSSLLLPSRLLSFDWIFRHISLYSDKASIFPPEAVASILRHDLQGATSLFCPVIGWSSYLIGFLLASSMNYFVGIDANPRNVEKLHQVSKDLGLPPSQVHILHGQTETFTADSLPLPPKGISGIFFSPPYYDRERYYGEGQSHKTYKTYESWCKGFYLPLFCLCARVLTATPAKMAIVVSDQTVGKIHYPLVLDTVRCANAAGFQLVSHRLVAIPGARKARSIDKASSESLLLFTKTLK